MAETVDARGFLKCVATTTFDFHGAPLRVLKGTQADLWFIAADVCRALGLRAHKGSYAEHLQKLGPGEVTLVSSTGVKLRGAGMHNSNLVSESGLYKLVLRSDKPVALKFQDWVTKEVLPAIRVDRRGIRPLFSGV